MEVELWTHVRLIGLHEAIVAETVAAIIAAFVAPIGCIHSVRAIVALAMPI